MTKQTPATPLPWHTQLGSESFYRIHERRLVTSGRGLEGTHISKMMHDERGEKDAAYIAHACNAYPKLVEVLRMVAPIIERFAGEAEPQNSVLDQRRDQLRALLRELGESA